MAPPSVLSERREPLEGACPSQHDLTAFSAGRLELDQLEAVASHVIACASCQAALESIHEPDQADSLIEKLRRCGAQAPSETPNHGLETQSTADPFARTHSFQGQMTTGPAPSQVPRRFGDYELLAGLGGGGMGVVYKARQPRLKRIVALKMIRPGMHTDPALRERFRIECEAVARLSHPNVVQVFECNEYDGQLFLVMEFLEGGSLSKKIPKEGMPPQDAARMVMLLARGIQAAHEQKIIHRDLKPANVLLDADGSPRVSDFGLARLLDADEQMTQTGDVLGTPSYMAPEQAAGRMKEIGPQTDVYALGAILYECLTGNPPFKGVSKQETIKQVATQAPVTPRKVRPDLPRDLEAICLKCLEKPRDLRPRSAGELADDLQNWLEGKRTQLQPTRGLRRLGYELRHRPRTLAVVTMLVIAALGFGYYWHPDRALWAMQAKLHRGEEVELIGETGGPAWSKWLLGDGEAQARTDPAGEFVVKSGPLALLDLSSWIGGDKSFSFTAEFRHLRSGQFGAVGVFVAGRTHAVPGGSVRSLVQVGFNDLLDDMAPYKGIDPKLLNPKSKGRGNRLRMKYVYRGDGGVLLKDETNLDGAYVSRPSGNPRTPGDWRKIKIDGNSKQLQVFWEGKLAFVATAETLREATLQVHQSHPVLLNIARPIDTGGACGLMVYDSEAAFRNVRITLVR